MKVTTTEFKAVHFPAGYSRAWGTLNAAHVAWVWNYTMLVPNGRGGIRFLDGDIMGGSSAASDPFPKAALRHCFERALKLKAGAVLEDTRTGIRIIRFAKGPAFDIRMPCGEQANIKVSTVRRLVEELL